MTATAPLHIPGSRLQGIFPILYTPFGVNGEVDEEDLRRLVNYLIAAGAHGLAATGGASEAAYLSANERRRFMEVVVQEAAGRVPVIAGVSAATTSESALLASQAGGAGVRAVFSTPAPGGHSERLALAAHFGALAHVTSLPLMVQDAPAAAVPTELALQLSRDVPQVSYVKEEALDAGHRVSELLEGSNGALSILTGGAHLLDELARGAAGAIPGSAGVADLATAYNAYRAGCHDDARAAFDHFTPLSYWRRQFPIVAVKEVLRRQGVFKAAVLRQPGQQLDRFDHAELTALLAKMGPPY